MVVISVMVENELTERKVVVRHTRPDQTCVLARPNEFYIRFAFGVVGT